MKKQLILAIALLVTVFSFAQKKEVKALEKAVNKNNYAEAKSLITQLEPMIGSMDDKLKDKYYLAAANAYFANGTSSAEDVLKATTLLDKVTADNSDVNVLRQDIENDLLTKANGFFTTKEFGKAAVAFENLYNVNKEEQAYLYYAASSAINNQDMDGALKYYLQLNDLGYTGVGTEYFATNKANGEEEILEKNARDNYVKLGTHENPGERQTESRAGEITKNIALIYANKGENDKALEAIATAKKNNPEDVNLIISEANIYNKMGDTAKFQELLQEAALKVPNDPTIHYNIGVVYMNSNEIAKARKSFEKVLELDPKNSDAALNLSTSYITEGNALIEQMNSLGTSKADNLKYDQLKNQKGQLFNDGANTLLNYIKIDPKAPDSIYEQLANIYNALGETEKAKEAKSHINK
ncbi:tetratricopeptide repeat protein [Olleya sp. UBA1516]|uniref:tetratricopeptide repeat protein n=1 Tax=Olleya sp. UBA1516 TaxID=1947013 RepID=UPI0025F91D47|nr:tetratricopeptide repeat protein [Olleya sp. UBA1516]|tara:strand:- start:377 stop:1612 length:1236 start_codon:yes stop_codon:yes gene_type:complete